MVVNVALDAAEAALLEATVTAFEQRLSQEDANAAEFTAAISVLNATGHLEQPYGLDGLGASEAENLLRLNQRLEALKRTIVSELTRRITDPETVSGAYLSAARQMLSHLGTLDAIRAALTDAAAEAPRDLPNGLTREDLEALPRFDGQHSKTSFRK